MGIPNKIIKRLGINLPEKYQWLGSAILGVLAFLAMTLLMWGVAQAEERDGWLTATSTYLLIENNIDGQHNFCAVKAGHLTSNLGADVTLYKRGWFEWHGRLTHHSCAFGPDAPDYNAVGTGIVLKFVRD